jgi:hypothetical protein
MMFSYAKLNTWKDSDSFLVNIYRIYAPNEKNNSLYFVRDSTEVWYFVQFSFFFLATTPFIIKTKLTVYVKKNLTYNNMLQACVIGLSLHL